MELQRIWIFTIFLFSLAAGCAQPGDPVSSSASPPPKLNWTDDPSTEANEAVCTSTDDLNAGIFGGQILDKHSWLAKGTVFILQSYRVDGQEKTAICTGSLIDKNLIMTAAHCVDRARNRLSNIAVYFSNEPECDSMHHRLEKKRKFVSALRIHPNWNPNETQTTNRGDIAMLRIQGTAPESYKPLRFANEFLPLVSGVEALVAGYGMVNANYYGEFGGPISLRVAKAPPISAAERDLLSSLGGSSPNEFSNLPTNEMLYVDQTKGQGICGGDSGGPSLMRNQRGEYVVTGVASYVMNPENPMLMCGYVAAHTSVIFHRTWIEQTFEELRNTDSQYLTPFLQ